MVLVMTLGVLLMQLVGCGGTSSNPGSSSSSANSHGSLSAIESQAQAVAIDAWIALLNARQGTPDHHLYLTVTNMAPSAVSQALSKGNTVSIAWESCGTESGTKGEVQIKNFKSIVWASDLSPSDEANGITWHGNMEIAYVMRFRSVRWYDFSSFSVDEISPPPDSEPFSPWLDVGMEMPHSRWDGKSWTTLILGSPVPISVVKQNGKWTATVGVGWAYAQGIIDPLSSSFISGPTLPFDYSESFSWTDGHNNYYGGKPYMIEQTTPYQPVTTTTTPITSNAVTNMMASEFNLGQLSFSFDNVAKAYDTSSPSYLKLYWTRGQYVCIPNSGTNLYAMGKYTQTKDGAGNYPGQCVSLVKALTFTSNIGTDSWKIGKRVIDGGVMPGTAIATFTKNNNTQYNSGIDHAAIFKGYLADGSGFEVWDQNWDFTGVVGTHAIKMTGPAGYPNTYANNYYVIQIPSKELDLIPSAEWLWTLCYIQDEIPLDAVIMTQPSYGSWILNIGQRRPFVDNGYYGYDTSSLRDVALVYSTSDPAQAAAIMAQRGTEYVIFTKDDLKIAGTIMAWAYPNSKYTSFPADSLVVRSLNREFVSWGGLEIVYAQEEVVLLRLAE